MSTAYVEKVVNPPSTPVPKKGRTRRWAAHTSVMTTMKTPITAHPMTLTQNVVQGNPPVSTGHSRAAPYRAVAPIAPPSETIATTGAWPCQGDMGRGVGRAAASALPTRSGRGSVMTYFSYSPGPGARAHLIASRDRWRRLRRGSGTAGHTAAPRHMIAAAEQGNADPTALAHLTAQQGP